ncbi:MAG: DUF5709 domain-containing protein [Actinomycetota bacterium]|nr:DUF5709 domain-containing protein [Actinomycetota bacterium]
MSTPNEEGPDAGIGFPDIVDDAAPERSGVPEPQVAALPGDDYLAVDNFGTTVEEQIEGEPLDRKLEREEPEPYVDPLAPAGIAESDEALAYEDRLLSDREGASPGRLVELDEGAHTDLDKDAVAYEADGESDFSAEEAAIHVVPET